MGRMGKRGIIAWTLIAFTLCIGFNIYLGQYDLAAFVAGCAAIQAMAYRMTVDT